MHTLRPAAERGHIDFGWLDTKHSFSFGHYFDRNHMGFRALRVINDDIVGAGAGFDEHPHANMEIVTVVLEGALAHKDSMGNGTTITPGEVQRMTAGTGITHSEFNASPSEAVHLLQIWILPEAKGLAPSYEQKRFDFSQPGLVRIGSHKGQDGAVTIHQDVELFRGTVKDSSVAYTLAPARHAWVQVISGPVTVNGTTLQAGDGLAISDETTLDFSGSAGDFLLFDLA